MRQPDGANMSVWGFLVRVGLALCWWLLTEAALFGCGLDYGYVTLSGDRIHDGWDVFVLCLPAYLAALFGLPVSVAFALWRFWRMCPDAHDHALRDRR